MGGEWHLLTPPLVDSNGVPISPCAGCSLQLFGPLEFSYGRFYTAPGVIGVMLSQGFYLFLCMLIPKRKYWNRINLQTRPSIYLFHQRCWCELVRNKERKLYL